ncbi:hypothetical protein ROA7745_00319 [Roseovarius aestuarii]|uniref:Uncharacterized protein n=1 Tax=Roseovarius aestuarii TaxID=475083 RepID=A0A1X7BLK2_9RHOB|nr:hypothetical protein ROA7745_00319 [Roseovarius aestuarii]
MVHSVFQVPTGTTIGVPFRVDGDPTMNRDELLQELRMHSASWQAVVIVYALIVGTMIFSAMAII